MSFLQNEVMGNFKFRVRVRTIQNFLKLSEILREIC